MEEILHQFGGGVTRWFFEVVNIPSLHRFSTDGAAGFLKHRLLHQGVAFFPLLEDVLPEKKTEAMVQREH